MLMVGATAAQWLLLGVLDTLREGSTGGGHRVGASGRGPVLLPWLLLSGAWEVGA